MPLKIFKKAAAHQPLIKIIECQIKKPCLVSKKNTGAIREKTYTYVLKSNHFGEMLTVELLDTNTRYTLKVKLVAVKFTYLRIV